MQWIHSLLTSGCADAATQELAALAAQHEHTLTEVARREAAAAEERGRAACASEAAAQRVATHEQLTYLKSQLQYAIQVGGLWVL